MAFDPGAFSFDDPGADRLMRVFLDLRDYSTEVSAILNRFMGRVRITGQGSLRPLLDSDAVNPIPLLDDSIRKWTRPARRRDITMRRGGDTRRSDIQRLLRGDGAALAEVFDNLIENAQKF